MKWYLLKTKIYIYLILYLICLLAMIELEYKSRLRKGEGVKAVNGSKYVN